MNAEQLRNAFLEVVRKVREVYPKSQHIDVAGKNFAPLDMLVVLERILFEKSFDEEVLSMIARFVDAMKNSLRLKKINLGNEMPIADSMLAAEMLGSFVPRFGPEILQRERYLPYWLYSESPYHKMKVNENGAIDFTYDENTPVVMIPLLSGAAGRPNALEYILWTLRRDARKKQCKKIKSADFIQEIMTN